MLRTAEETVRWVVGEFGESACLLASMQDAVLIDVALNVEPSLEVVFLDTGYHFEETWETLRAVEQRYETTVKVIAHDQPRPAEPIAPGACCDDKADLLDQALDGRAAWLSGIRRSETATRAHVSIIDIDRRDLIKVSPLAQWNDDDVQRHIDARNVTVNPLIAQGYPSIGCATCTIRPHDPTDTRSGRWADQDKTECGLHL